MGTQGLGGRHTQRSACGGLPGAPDRTYRSKYLLLPNFVAGNRPRESQWVLRAGAGTGSCQGGCAPEAVGGQRAAPPGWALGLLGRRRRGGGSGASAGQLWAAGGPGSAGARTRGCLACPPWAWAWASIRAGGALRCGLRVGRPAVLAGAPATRAPTAQARPGHLQGQARGARALPAVPSRTRSPRPRPLPPPPPGLVSGKPGARDSASRAAGVPGDERDRAAQRGPGSRAPICVRLRCQPTGRSPPARAGPAPVVGPEAVSSAAADAGRSRARTPGLPGPHASGPACAAPAPAARAPVSAPPDRGDRAAAQPRGRAPRSDAPDLPARPGPRLTAARSSPAGRTARAARGRDSRAGGRRAGRGGAGLSRAGGGAGAEETPIAAPLAGPARSPASPARGCGRGAPVHAGARG